MSPDSSPLRPCMGWWEQRWLGRQAMEKLGLAIHDREVQGSGEDVVGRFTLQGTLDRHGGIAFQKQYLGRHTVVYRGRYDGEGTFAGDWELAGDQGTWLMAFRRIPFEPSQPIQEWPPRS